MTFLLFINYLTADIPW